MLDLHTHTNISHDGKATLEEMIAGAKEKGIKTLAITEHLDRDYLYCQLEERNVKQLDLAAYYKEFEAVREKTDGIKLLFGVECGYSKAAEKNYNAELPDYDFDVIINSVHSVDGRDAYFSKTYEEVGEEEIVNAYLDCVYDSVMAGYEYDVIAHIGYLMRYVPYSDRRLYRKPYAERVDAILEGIVKRNKTLELNAQIKCLPAPCLPERAIIKRYKELGGKSISYGSDAHNPERLGERYEAIKELAKEFGFNSWTVYEKRKAHEEGM